MDPNITKWNQARFWRELLPPSRPSLHHLRFFRDALHFTPRDAPVAVLGSTPELRDLLAFMGFTAIFVIDNSSAFHRSVTHLRAYSNSETVVHADWTEYFTNTNTRFAAILSDLTSGNIRYTDRGNFYRMIAGSLSSGGIFIDKILCQFTPPKLLEALDEKYAEGPINLATVNDFSCDYFFVSELTTAHRIVDVNLFLRVLRARFTNPYLRCLLEECRRITPENGTWHYGRNWTGVEQETYFQDLELVTEGEDETLSTYFGHLKLLVSRPSRRERQL